MAISTFLIAKAIPAAIRPYSIAVAPDSSDQNFKTMRFKTRLRFYFKMCGLAPTPENLRDTTCDAVNPEIATYPENWNKSSKN